MDDDFRVIYWDTSAILSVLFKDRHSNTAQKWVHEEGVHFISTLAYAEACAVIARMQRESVVADILAQASFETLDKGPWRRLAAWPEWIIVQSLSAKWPLRGTNLWHLATAKSIQKEIPELFLLTFDARLQKAAKGEGLVSTIK
ncbi:MAG: type II toxin-antitoxin system VapC family toxin [Syntrophales bacterium]|nr:type II toxin-antitoxin system VapC family toxin [Syntrophales bacterium]